MSFNKQKDFGLHSVELIKPRQGGTYDYYDIRDKFVTATIYQDIFNSVVSGKVVIMDTEDILSNIPLTGNEFFRLGISYPDTSLTGLLDETLTFNESSGLIENIDSVLSNINLGGISDVLGNFLTSFFRTNRESLPSIQNLFSNIQGMTDTKRKLQYFLFRVYKVDNSAMLADNSKLETLRLIAPEYIWNLQTKFNKNFVQEQVSSIVASYFTDLKNFYSDTHPEIYESKLKQDALSIEETSGLINYSSVQTNPFTIINALSSIATSKLDNSANYVFYQNNIGFNFRSLSSIFSQDNSLQFFARNPNIPTDKQAAFKYDALAFEKINRMQSFDTINNLREGLYGSRLLSVDPLRRKFYKKDYKLSEEFFKYNQSESENPQLQIEENFEGMDKINARQLLLQSSAGHDTTPYLKAYDPTMTDEQVEKISQLRSSQMRLLEQSKNYIKLPGHPSINAGQKCNFSMPNFASLDQHTKNKYLHGSYVISACAHQITLDKYEIETELIKTDFYSRIQFSEV